ncbi:GGDEF domain-containing response regulator [Azospirillum canadense]|uniref:GGDEF domain-containing response regulator n=1 Tax=Azospirillum canadense TaxID=403962 RepID=UPI002226CC02|nr:diguanylate cyclase [Azospirillum canadense]MCW2236593.1 two-component system chemotaxis response regulator CheY [Azospirillum canadense]
MRVLIADDTVLMRAILSEQVASYGHEVILARDGQEALDCAWSEPFDIAIIDWEMPRLSGLEVCWHLRADPRTAYAYLILMTAHDDAFYEFKALDAGADDFIHKPVNSAHLKARLKAGGRITAMHRQLLDQARTDPLTGLANRRSVLERADEEIARSRRYGHPLSVVMADIDHFKRINDTYGHAAGDEALRRFAQALRDDLRPCDLLGRYGGEEFVVLLPETGIDDAPLVAERLRALVAALPVVQDGVRFHMTASFGVAAVDAAVMVSSPTGGRGIEPALKEADAALYRAKEAGRNRVVVAD